MRIAKKLHGEKQRVALDRIPVDAPMGTDISHSKELEIDNGKDVRAILKAMEIVGMRLRLILEELEAHDELRERMNSYSGKGGADAESSEVAAPTRRYDSKRRRPTLRH